MVYTVCACANSGGIPPAPVTIPYTIMHQLNSEFFIQVGFTASPSATFDKAVSYSLYVRISKRPNSVRMREQCVPGALFSPHPLRLGMRLGYISSDYYYFKQKT